MVIIKEHAVKWKCPYCSDIYETEDDANDCAKDCVLDDVDKAEEVNNDDTEYICKYCKESYDNNIDAEDCEEEHTEIEDSDFEEFKRQESVLLLQEAAKHPQQVKLSKF